MRVEHIDIADPAWGEFVSTHPDATPFHLPEWASMIAECYRFDAFVLAVRDAGGELLAGAPTIAVRSPLGRLRWVSLPFSDSCPLLIRPEIGPDEVVEALTHHALAGPASELEVRSALPAGDSVYPVQVGYNHALALPARQAELKPDRNHRRNRDRALRAGVTVSRSTTPDDIDTFYHMHVLTRHRLGVPVHPRRHINLVRERLLSQGRGFILTARLDGAPVASCIYLMYNRTLLSKYRASDPSLPGSGANHLIDWEAMRIGIEEGCDTLDMGRSDLEADGLRQYKSMWGAVERPLVYTRVAHNLRTDRRSSLSTAATRFLQLAPAWVCWAVGEGFYRWSA